LNSIAAAAISGAELVKFSTGLGFPGAATMLGYFARSPTRHFRCR
jgi:hypothetical protein